MLHRTLARLFLGAALLGAAPTARATTLAELTTEQLTDASTWIVEGEVLDVWAEADAQGHIWTRASVAVKTRHKGPETPSTIVVDTLGGELGRARTTLHGAPRFSVGEQVVLFLSEIEHGRRVTPVAMTFGKLTVRRAPGELRRYVRQVNLSVREAYDHRFLPHPAPEDRVYLDDLLDAVHTRLDTGWTGEPIPGISPERLEAINTPERRLRR